MAADTGLELADVRSFQAGLFWPPRYLLHTLCIFMYVLKLNVNEPLFITYSCGQCPHSVERRLKYFVFNAYIMH